MDSKVCTKCKEEKPLAEYYKNKSAPSGLDVACKDCRKEAVRNRYHEKMADPDFAERERNRRRVAMMSERQLANRRVTVKRAKDKYVRCGGNAAGVAKRRQAKADRTPSWANEQLIAAYYTEAKRLEKLTGIKFHVDHIIPLQGELVSGLHVETNLQLLPAHENLGKSNSFDPELFVA